MKKRRILNEKIVKEEAKKYKSKSEFEKYDRGCYNWAWKNKILNNLFSNKKRILTEEFVREQAKKYKSKSEFYKKDSSCYNWALKNNILDELFVNKRRTLTEEFVREQAKKYNSKKEFELGDKSCYLWALEHEIISVLFENKRRTLTEEFVREQAKKYSSKEEFCKKDSSCHTWAYRNGILDELFSNKTNYEKYKTYPHDVYKITLKNKLNTNEKDNIYIGISSNSKKRISIHKNGSTKPSAVNKKISKNYVIINIEYLYKNVTYDYAYSMETKLINNLMKDKNIICINECLKGNKYE